MCWEMFYALLYSGRDCIVGLYCWYCFKILSEEIEIAGSLKKTEFQKNIYFCFVDFTKDFDCVDHNKLWKIL